MRRVGPEQTVRVVVARPDAEARERVIVALRADPRLTVVGTARTGAEAVRAVTRTQPSLVLLDATLSGPGVVDTTHDIMSTVATPIVVLADPSSEGAEALAALDAGAVSVQREPSGTGPEAVRFSSVIIALADVAIVRRRATRSPERPPPPRSAEHAQVVAIAASTGGPAALQCLLTDLPERFDLPVLLVQHLPNGYTEQFARWLGEASAFQTVVAEDGTPLKPRHVHIAPDDMHLTVTADGLIGLTDSAPVDGFRPSATVLFRSVAEAYGPRAVGVVLSGMGRDGVEGLRALRASGARVLAQDEVTSVVFGMPGEAVAAGVVDDVAPVGLIAARLLAVTREGQETT